MLKLIIVVSLTLIHVRSALASTEDTNAPVKVTIQELLQHKDKWRLKRVDVSGFYESSFEYSVLTTTNGASVETGLWIDRFRVAVGGKEKLRWVNRGNVRVIGTFHVRAEGSRHMGIYPVELTNLELFEPTNTSTNQGSASKEVKPPAK